METHSYTLHDLVAQARGAEVALELSRGDPGARLLLDQAQGRLDPGVRLTGPGLGAATQPSKFPAGQVPPGGLTDAA